MDVLAGKYTDFRESVADSSLTFFYWFTVLLYFPNTTQLSLELIKHSKVYNLLTFNFARTLLLVSCPVLLIIALVLES